MLRPPNPTSLILTISAVIAYSGCSNVSMPHVQVQVADGLSTAAQESTELHAQVVQFCGSCHVPPDPNTFPKSAWPREVARGFTFYEESQRTDVQVPSQEQVVQYYQQLAPESLQVEKPPVEIVESNKSLNFRQTESPTPGFEGPAVSYMSWMSIDSSKQPALLLCDMRSGELRSIDVTSPRLDSRRLLAARNLAHVEPCDLDNNGQVDFVCADLGSISSGDHRRGAVIWSRRRSVSSWESILLLSGIGRVADVQVADFDQDNDPDLLVAEFGHFRTGGIHLLENVGLRNSIPEFKRHTIDSRHGTICVPTADLNADGKLDFVALVSQEHETVDAFLNQGNCEFERKTILPGNDPAYGSSSVELVDIEGDGDLDVVYANGDTFGSDSLKPYHAIHWLENQGGYPFVPHRLTTMVGVQSARVADLDGDGDRDIIAAALMPRHLAKLPALADHDSLLWLEQVAAGKFVRRGLEKGNFVHAAACPADFDGDGDIDLAVGNLQDDSDSLRPWLTVWWNDRQARTSPGNEQRVGP